MKIPLVNDLNSQSTEFLNGSQSYTCTLPGLFPGNCSPETLLRELKPPHAENEGPIRRLISVANGNLTTLIPGILNF